MKHIVKQKWGIVRRTGVPDAAEVLADPGELGGGHADDGLVLGVGDAQVLAVDVHELHLEVGDLVLVCPSEEQPKSERVPMDREGRSKETNRSGEKGVSYWATRT